MSAIFPVFQGIDSHYFLWYILLVNGCDKDTRALKDAQRGAGLLRWLCTPALRDTTFEPTAGNGCPGTPVKASMSGSVFQGNQGGTVEYIIYNMYPTPDYVRGGIFI